jgi:hypothetical protein
MTGLRTRAKILAGRLPWAPELYQDLFARQRPPATGFALGRLENSLPAWVEAVEKARASADRRVARRVLVVGYLTWWLEFSVALGMLLAAQGHSVDLGYLPYRRWTKPVDPFDVRRQRAYLQRVLLAARPLRPVDLSRPTAESIPAVVADRLDHLSLTDVEYTLQSEGPDFDQDLQARELFALRRSRNNAAAGNALRLIGAEAYDAVVIPNGSILEFAAVYQAARFLGVPTVTYEFGEQRERVWVCRDGEAMRLNTDDLWKARGGPNLTPAERQEIETLVGARKGGQEWQQFRRRWQPAQRQGASNVRNDLGLDDVRPIILLATNVVGDSLALNRQIFTGGMADWLSQTLGHLAQRADIQTVVRVHPGELLGAGLPSEQIVRQTLPVVPKHVTLIPPESTVNTYDLIDNAHLGLVYTSTAGLEMAMHGVPVLTAGQTHYRGKGFTDDPETLQDYFRLLAIRLAEPIGRTLSQDRIELAWRYAHRFFFEFPFRFPWHLLQFWKDMEARPLEKLVSERFPGPYAEVLGVMVGESVDWEQHARLR